MLDRRGVERHAFGREGSHVALGVVPRLNVPQFLVSFYPWVTLRFQQRFAPDHYTVLSKGFNVEGPGTIAVLTKV